MCTAALLQRPQAPLKFCMKLAVLLAIACLIGLGSAASGGQSHACTAPHVANVASPTGNDSNERVRMLSTCLRVSTKYSGGSNIPQEALCVIITLVQPNETDTSTPPGSISASSGEPAPHLQENANYVNNYNKLNGKQDLPAPGSPPLDAVGPVSVFERLYLVCAPSVISPVDSQ